VCVCVCVRVCAYACACVHINSHDAKPPAYTKISPQYQHLTN